LECACRSCGTVSRRFALTLFAACPSSQDVPATAGQCGATVTFGTLTVQDNCDCSMIVQVSGLPNASFFPVGTNTSVFAVSDTSSNLATCSFDVVVRDTQAPVISKNRAGPCDSSLCFDLSWLSCSWLVLLSCCPLCSALLSSPLLMPTSLPGFDHFEQHPWHVRSHCELHRCHCQ
jgi:hypothetical protein